MATKTQALTMQLVGPQCYRDSEGWMRQMSAANPTTQEREEMAAVAESEAEGLARRLLTRYGPRAGGYQKEPRTLSAVVRDGRGLKVAEYKAVPTYTADQRADPRDPPFSWTVARVEIVRA